MMKVHFPDREDIDKLLMRIKIINFDIPLEELKLHYLQINSLDISIF